MRRAIERRQEELEDLEDTKCRRKSYALAQQEALPIPLPLPVYPPPKPIARPPPPRTMFRPVGPRAHARGYRPSASINLLPSTPEVPSTPPVRNSQPRGLSSLAPTLEEDPKGVPNSQWHTHPIKGEDHPFPGYHSIPESSPNLDALRSPPRDLTPGTTRISPPPGESNDADVPPPQAPSTPNSLPSTPPAHHLPPTPTSLSRSDTPNSLTCPRTPTSIRAAPWQPATPTSLSHKDPSSPTAEVTRSPATYPPTPPSSPSHPGLLDVTPSSSLSSSLDQGLGHSNLSLSSIQHLPDSSTTNLKQEEEEEEELSSPSNHCLEEDEPMELSSPNHRLEEEKKKEAEGAPPLPYLSILDVTHLNADVRKGVVMATAPLESHSSKDASRTGDNGLHAASLMNSSNDPTKEGLDGVPNGLDLNDLNKNKPTTPQETIYKTYRRRFWILALFSATAFLQSTVWGTFGSIAESAKEAFPHWTDATIAAFPNWGPIIVVVSTIPMMWVTQKLGLRLGMVACMVLISTATLLRCVTSHEAEFTILCHVGSVLNAFAACLTLSLPAMVAATWFPPHERTTATAVGALWCQLGGAAIYMGPLIVRAPSEEVSPEDIRGDIMTLMYIHFGAAAFLLIAVLAYFPATPPSPPSASSAEERIDFLAGIKAIVKNRQLLLVIIVYSFSFGVPVVWIGVLTFSLLQIDIHQDAAMGVAVTAVLCSGLAAFITARITDKVYGHLKITIIGLLLASAIFFFWFVLLSTGVIAPNLAQAYISVTGGISFEYATVPLLVELAVELGYPIPEGVIGAILTLLFNIVALVFLGLFQIPDIGYIWVSYVLLACVSLTVVPLMFVTETHKRFETDQKERTENP